MKGWNKDRIKHTLYGFLAGFVPLVWSIYFMYDLDKKSAVLDEAMRYVEDMEVETAKVRCIATGECDTFEMLEPKYLVWKAEGLSTICESQLITFQKYAYEQGVFDELVEKATRQSHIDFQKWKQTNHNPLHTVKGLLNSKP